MPTVDVNLSDLNRLLGEKHSVSKLRESLRNLGMEVEDITTKGLKLEVHHDRPDLLGIEGISRALRGYLGIESGLPNYSLKEPEIKLEIDPSIEETRPVAVMGVIENAELDDISLKALMDLQEKLHEIMGRDRQKISIGAYDISEIEPPIHYTTVEPDWEGFVPLEFSEKLTPREILEKHPKGKKYRHLVEEFDRYPLLVGSGGTVLSMPPIINSEATKVTSSVRKMGVDVTGVDERIAMQAMNIIMTSAAERGFDIRKMEVEYPKRKTITPNLDIKKKDFDLKRANKKLGLNLDVKQALEILERMRYRASQTDNSHIEVQIPPYRFDIMHEVDLFEDIAIGYGYDNLEPTLPSIEITGKPNPKKETSQIARRVLTGLGFFEVMPYLLTNPELNFQKMKTDGEAAVIKNPVSEEYTILRTWLLPGLLDVLKANKQHEISQKIFEVDDVVLLDKETETGARNVRRAAGAVIGDEVDFTYARSIVEALLRELRAEWNVEPLNHASFLEGRAAEILSDGERLGFVGELNPEVILNFELEHPVIAFEIDLLG